MPAPIVISVKTEFGKLEAQLTDLEKTQLPFVRSQVANRLAKQAVLDIQTEMSRVFDRPTKWVLRGIYARTGTKRDPHGEVVIKDRGFTKGVGTPAQDILSAEVLGGTRKLKRFERALGHRIGDATYIVPGRGAKLDAFGNMPIGQIEKVLSALGAAESSAGYVANRRAYSKEELSEKYGKGKRKGQYKVNVYFVATSRRDGRPLGVYKIVGKGKIEPVFFFPRAKPHYHERLDFYAVVKKSVEKNAVPAFRDEMGKALATAKN